MARRDRTPSRDADPRVAPDAGPHGRVQVAYALPDRQRVVTLELPAGGLTAGQAVQRSGLVQEFPEIAAQAQVLAVFGALCKPDRPLRAGDRVEILRPLRQDPRAQRRERVAATRPARRR